MSSTNLPNGIEKSMLSGASYSCGHHSCTRSAPHRCGRCKHTHYCSVEHQRADWVQGHQYLCDKLSVTHTFAYTQITQLLKAAANDKTVVSVGSGNGCHEAVISRMYPEIPIVCVDPKPESFAAYPTDGTYFKRPDYATVDQLVRARPNIVGACVVLLVWTDSRLDYDMDAIEKLSPGSIVVLYDWMGSAGGARFNSWMDTLPMAAPKTRKSNESSAMDSNDNDDSDESDDGDNDDVKSPRTATERAKNNVEASDENASNQDGETPLVVPVVVEQTKSCSRFEINLLRRHTLKTSKFSRIYPTLAWVSRVPGIV